MIKCILYDLDGTLVDATEWHYIALNKALKTIAGNKAVISKEEHEKIFNGWPTTNKLNELLKQERIKESDIKTIWDLKQRFTKEAIIENSEIDVDKVLLHTVLKSFKMKLACVTNSILETAELMLKKTGQYPFMDLLISNDMIKIPKPHGEGYIKAMITLGCMPEECLIIEDSIKGFMAAESTGANLLKVNNNKEVNLKTILSEICK